MNLPSEVVEAGKGAWGITSFDQLLSNMEVAENGGDWQECIDALRALLGRRFRIEEVIHMDFNEPLFRLVEVTDGD